MNITSFSLTLLLTVSSSLYFYSLYVLCLQGPERQPNQQYHARSFFRPVKPSKTVSMHDSHTVWGQNIRDSDRNFDDRYISPVCDR